MGALSLTTRAAIVLMWCVFATVVVFCFLVCWGMWAALDDDLLFALAFILAPILLGAVGMMLGALPKLLVFVVRFTHAEASAYYGGFVPAVAALGVSFLIAAVGAPVSWWIGPMLAGIAIVVLLVHPDTRDDFLRRDGAETEARAARVVWMGDDPI